MCENLESEVFSFIELVEKYYIEIPKIQRDYAQGRTSDRVNEVRDDFLKQINIYLDSSINNNNLDFIYGDIINIDNEEKLIVLDGQQRLTTLFLLHWYTALVAKKYDNFKSILLKNKESKFTYNTRESAKKFCLNLVEKGDTIYNQLKNYSCLSEAIKDQTWFYINWINDLTIQSMLVMIDAIQLQFGNNKSYYEKLTNKEHPSLVFNFLPIELQGLSDDLYIKMNARGKELTRFENFKSKLLGEFDELIIKRNNDEILKEMRKQFAKKIDTDWIDTFWDLQEDKTKCEHFDDTLLNFFEVIFINSYALHITTLDNNKQNEIDELKSNLKHWIDNPRKISFKYILKYENFEQLVKDYFIILNAIIDNRKLRIYLDEASKYNELKQFSKILNISGEAANYRDRLSFYSYYSYLIKHCDFKNKTFISNVNTVDFNHWMRLSSNLINNIPYINNETEFMRALNSIRLILNNSKTDIYKEYTALDLTKLKGIDESQIKEEKIKIILMQKNKEWSSAILEAEKQQYFNGQLAFAISYAAGNKSIIDSNTDDIVTSIDKSKFDKIIAVTFTLFNNKGIADEAKKNYKLQRALLAISDSYYMLSSGSKISFLINNHRDISWKNYMKGANTFDQRTYYYNLIDCKDFDYKKLTSLEIICTKNLGGDIDATKLFVTHPEIFTYKPENQDDMLPVSLGNSELVDWHEEYNPVYILSGKQLNSYHNELRSECKYFDFLKKKIKLDPFSKLSYYATKTIDEMPCLVINTWLFNIHNFAIDCVWNSKKSIFNLYFFDRNEKISSIPPTIKDILKNNKFIFIEKEKRYKKLDIEYDNLENTLISICKSFKLLNS